MGKTTVVVPSFEPQASLRVCMDVLRLHAYGEWK